MTHNKTTFRKYCLNRLKNSSQHNKFYKNALLNKQLFQILKTKKRQKILFYYPLPMEANIIKTLKEMRKNCDIYIPFMVGQSFKMVPFRLPLEMKKFNILESRDTLRNINKIDIAIVPIVGVDGNLQRIGFGKGMYDRFFEKLQKRPYIIFTQLEFCYTKEKICDDYDIACDLLLTPQKVIKAKKYRK